MLLLNFTKAFSAVFVVTSNADSGPGTLRDALTQAAANGSATTDFINFNLADQSVAGRTITLLSQLSPLSANLVIDATTQPGPAFGVSNAKVKLFDNFLPPSTTPPYIIQASGLGDFTISGLWLDAITWDGQDNAFCIGISSSTSVTISHCLMPAGNIDISNCGTFTCQSNLIGYLPDGITGFPTIITTDDVLNVIIGGTSSQGNLLSGAVNLNDDNQNWTYLISNNKMGTDYTGKSSSVRLFSLNGRINISSGLYQPPGPGKMLGTITNNLIENFFTTGIVVSGFGDVSIKGNAIGADNTSKINFFQFAPNYAQNTATTAIILQLGINAVVGGPNPADSNVIGYTTNGILEQLANQVVISQNSIFCINPYNFNIHDFVTQAYTKPLPQIQINTITNNSISGIATPGARVEIFSNAEGECSTCDPRDFFTFVTADNNGNWSYNGVIPANIVASAIYTNQTSLFTKATVVIDNLKVTQPKCGDNTGSIQGIKFFNAGQTRWVDQNGNVVSTSTDVNNLPPGKYKFKVGSNVCGAESDWIELIDNSIKIDFSNVKIQNPACNVGGSISGLLISAYQNESFNATWRDENLNPVGNSVDIGNLIPGKYTLTVTGAITACSQTYGPITFIPDPNIIALDESKVQVTIASCSMDNGSITGMQVSGNAQYKWVDANNTTVATTVDLQNAAPGDYVFTAYNQFGCSQTSKSYHIGALPPTQFPVYSNIITAACANTNNGSINLTTDALVKSARWVNSQGATVGNATDLNNVAAGIYGLYLTDQNGCETFYNNFTVDEISPIQILQSSAQIVNIQCGVGLGSITGIEIAGGQLPYNYTWTDAGGNVIASTPDITALSAGDYTLTVKDARDCNVASGKYTIQDIENILSAPSADNIQICSPGATFLIVNNPTAGHTYRLYNNENDPTPIDTQPGGKFKIDAQSNRKYYVSEAMGSCESSRTEVSVTVGISGINIANTITPNGDGINDYWNITGIQDYPTCLVQIFTRYGQKVFESKGYGHPFDGTLNGTVLPVGVYYYIINLNTNCNLLSGSLTIIR